MLQDLMEELTLLQERWALTDDWMDRVCHANFRSLRGISRETVADEAALGEGAALPLLERSNTDVRDLDLRGCRAFASIGRKLALWLKSPDAEIEWLTQPNDAFGGLAPIDVCASSLENVQWVAYTLDTHLIASAKQNESNLEL